MRAKAFIKIKTRVDALHNWPECPLPEVSFLKSPHRHTFFVEVELWTYHTDRAVEFIVLKNEVDALLNSFGVPVEGLPNTRDFGSSSCEMIADALYKELGLKYDIKSIYVSEDDLTGGGIALC